MRQQTKHRLENRGKCEILHALTHEFDFGLLMEQGFLRVSYSLTASLESGPSVERLWVHDPHLQTQKLAPEWLDQDRPRQPLGLAGPTLGSHSTQIHRPTTVVSWWGIIASPGARPRGEEVTAAFCSGLAKGRGDGCALPGLAIVPAVGVVRNL